jgi:hypothetical protein
MLTFVGFDQRYQHVEPLPFGRLGLGPHQLLDLAEGCSIVLFGFDRLDVHSLSPSSYWE